MIYRCRAYFPLSRGGLKVISSPESRSRLAFGSEWCFHSFSHWRMPHVALILPRVDGPLSQQCNQSEHCSLPAGSMASNIRGRDASDLLSTELWSKVFSQMHPHLPRECLRNRQLYHKQEELLKLRLVCRVFKAVCDSQPWVTICLPASRTRQFPA